MPHDTDLPKSRAEAKAMRVGQYFTGIPCKNGHTVKRQTINGSCVTCAYQLQKKRLAKNIEDTRHKAAIRTRKWRSKNPEHSRAVNQKHNRGYVLEWRKKNKVKVRSYNQNYRARSNSAEGTFTADDIVRIFKQQNGKCAYYQSCNNKLGKKYHIDHIIALINGGTNFPSNIQLTCPKCNHRKNDRQPDVYSRELGLLL
jgi:5-methylcytosine-specific restriction endonuclease McrA